MIKFYPSNQAYRKLKFLLNFTLLPQRGDQFFLPKSNQQRLFSYHFSYSYIPLITWTPNITILDWTVQWTLLYTVHCTVQCTVPRPQSGWLSRQILWSLTSSLLLVNYNIHYTVQCTLCTVHCRLYSVHCTEHYTAQFSVHYIGHCSLHITVHSVLHYTLQRQQQGYWKNTVNWTKHCTVILSL